MLERIENGEIDTRFGIGAYQLAVIAVGYGKVRVPFLTAPPAFAAHRAVGDTIALLLLCTGVMCVSVYGFEDDAAVHAVAGSALLTVLAFKVSVVRRDFGLGRFLPLIAAVLIVAIAITVVTLKFGTTSAAEREAREERQEERLEAEQERREERRDR